MIELPLWILPTAGLVAWFAYAVVVFRTDPHKIVGPADAVYCRDCGPGVLCVEAVRS